MKLQSMKRTEEDRKKSAGTIMEGEQPDYPWGLRITLNDEQIKALGIKALPAVGAKCAIEAVGIIQSVSDEAVDNGESNQRIEIQITDLALAAPGTSKFAAMYDGDPKMKD